MNREFDPRKAAASDGTKQAASNQPAPVAQPDSTSSAIDPAIDPATEPASGTGAAAVAGATIGALAGAAGGPVGAIVGAIAGGVGGAYMGKAFAHRADPAVESQYWRSEYPNRPYSVPERSYEDYEPAYRIGWEIYDPETAEEWSDREELARQRWEAEGGSPTMSWEEARAASEDAYYRLHKRRPTS